MRRTQTLRVALAVACALSFLSHPAPARARRAPARAEAVAAASGMPPASSDGAAPTSQPAAGQQTTTQADDPTAPAGSVVIGGTDSSNCYPFGVCDYFGPYQQFYSSSQFGGEPVIITQVAFATGRRVPLGSTSSDAAYSLSVSMSNTTATPSSFSPTYAANRGPNFTTVYSGPFYARLESSNPDHNFNFVINLTRAFRYDPAQGNLLLEVNIQSASGPTKANYFWAGSSPYTGRNYSASPTNSTTGNGPGIDSASSNYGLLTQFTTIPASPLIISEFRFSGTNTQDEFVELYNNTDSAVTVSTTDGSAGWALVSNDSGAVTVRGRINNGTVIPARAHYLFASSPFIGGYQLTGYAVPDAAMIPPDISDGGGVALFRTADPANFTLANRLDAVGFSGVADPLYREGAGLSPAGGIGPNTSNYSFVRDLSTGTPRETDDNASDFKLVSTTAAVLNGVQSTLGAPGPENLASPVDRTANFGVALFDATQSASAAPNRERDFTPDPANNSPQGTLTIRRRVTNNTGGNVTRLRFRVIIITGSPSQGSGVADLRVRTSPDSTVNGQTVLGTAVESPSVSNNGGLNTSLSVPSVTTGPVSSGGPTTSGDEVTGPGGVPVYDDTVTLGAPLANGSSLNVQFLLGVVQTGRFRFYVNIEALP